MRKNILKMKNKTVQGKSEITLEHLLEACKYIFNNQREEPNKRVVVFRQYCKRVGRPVMRSGLGGLNLCSDKECTNCRNIEEMFSEQAVNYCNKPFYSLTDFERKDLIMMRGRIFKKF